MPRNEAPKFGEISGNGLEYISEKRSHSGFADLPLMRFRSVRVPACRIFLNLMDPQVLFESQ